jgi:hypothetical protein
MSLYDNGKYPFIDLINKFVGKPHVQAYLVYKRAKLFDESMFDDPASCCVEQWLYNEDAKQISDELRGFVAGMTFDPLDYPDVDQVIAHEQLFSELCPIWNHMETTNNWEKDERWQHETDMIKNES